MKGLVLLVVVLLGALANDDSNGVLVAVLSDPHINMSPNPSCLPPHTQSNVSVPTLFCDPPLSLVRSLLYASRVCSTSHCLGGERAAGATIEAELL